MDLLKQFILEYDAKGISCGLDNNNIGDMNLWVYESPSITELNQQLKDKIQIIDELESMEETYNESLFKLLAKLIRNISMRIKKKKT